MRCWSGGPRRWRAASAWLRPSSPARAENAEIWDVEGKRYIDFAGGIAVLNVGHRHPAVMKRVQEQLASITHTCFTIMPYAPFIELAEKLNALAPILGEKKSLFVTTGAEAVENAVKIARAYTGRSDVIGFQGSFHGRTLLTMALTGKIIPYKTKFGPFPAGIWHVPFPVAHKGISVDDAMRAIEWLFKCDVEPSRVAAIVIEPVQGEGGFYVAPKDLMVRLRKLCDEHGIVFIADEIQSGFGRTGKWFAMEHYGRRARSHDGRQKSSPAGSRWPASSAAPRSWMRPIPAASAEPMPAIPSPARRRSASSKPSSRTSCSRKRPKPGQGDHEAAQGDQGEGQGHADRRYPRPRRHDRLRTGDRAGRQQARCGGAKALAAKCLERGLLILTCGVWNDTIRLLCPLSASEKIVEEGLDILEAAVLGN